MPYTVLSLVRSHAPEHRPGRLRLLERIRSVPAGQRAAARTAATST